MENINLPGNLSGEQFYKLLEWCHVSKELKEYLDLTCLKGDYDSYKRKKELFGEFVDYAVSDIGNGLLESIDDIHTVNIITKPKYTMDLVWDNLKSYLLDDHVNNKEMSKAVLDFFDYFTYQHCIDNPYNEQSVSELYLNKDRDTVENAWEMLKSGNKYQTKLLNGSSLSDELDHIFENHNICLAFSYVDEKQIKGIDDVYFLYDIDGNRRHFSLLEDTTKLQEDLLALSLGYTSIKDKMPVKIESSSNDCSLTKMNPFLINIVTNLNDESNKVRKMVNPYAKITK